jgi:hypothetical protein
MIGTESNQDQKKISRLFKEIATLFRLQAIGGGILTIFWLYEFFTQANLPLFFSDSLISFLVGVMGGLSLWFFSRRKGTEVILITLVSIIILNLYSVLASFGVNIVLTVFETIILICLVALKNRKEL